MINKLLNKLYSAEHKVLYFFIAVSYAFFAVLIYFE